VGVGVINCDGTDFDVLLPITVNASGGFYKVIVKARMREYVDNISFLWYVTFICK
jgi:hypothetical protein